MSSWSCRHESSGICRKVDGAYCRPGMKGCILVGKVKFEDGVVPAPVWPEGHRASRVRDAGVGGDGAPTEGGGAGGAGEAEPG